MAYLQNIDCKNIDVDETKSPGFIKEDAETCDLDYMVQKLETTQADSLAKCIALVAKKVSKRCYEDSDIIDEPVKKQTKKSELSYLSLFADTAEANLTQVDEYMTFFNIHESWREFLSCDLGSGWFKNIVVQYKRKVEQTMVLPPRPDIFSWTHYCKPHEVKVVIMGQDPYPTIGNAHGLSFSVRPGKSIPKSLQYIFSELQRSYPDFVYPKDGYLEKWARQGVLLLNSVLTVDANMPCSHGNMGWKQFTRGVVERLCMELNNLVFMLWGMVAQHAISPNKNNHLILKGIHPSPRAQFRTKFVGNNHFILANEYLQKHGKTAIDWNL